MNNNDTENNVDGFRLISSLHTTVRQLSICSEIIKTLSGRQLPKEILFQLMIKWSAEKELNSEKYKNSKGKLTEDGKPTTAFKNYLDLCDSLKLVSHFNEFYSCSRLSYILLHFLEKKTEDLFCFSEKVFYLVQLLLVDADGISYILDEVNKHPISQKELQTNFKNNFNKRLIAKQDLATPMVKNTISERYRAINYIWKKPEKYSEHLLIPRCEWLTTLEILEINKQGNFTVYSVTDKGKIFIENLPSLFHSNITDINENWLFNNLFFSIQSLYVNKNITIFKNLDEKKKIVELGKGLNDALKVVKTSNSFKIPLFDSLIFISIDFFCNRNILIEMNDILVLLKDGITSNSRIFNLKFEGRINESYITANII